MAAKHVNLMKIENLIEEGIKNFALEADAKTVKESLGELLPDMQAYDKMKENLKKEIDILVKAH